MIFLVSTVKRPGGTEEITAITGPYTKGEVAAVNWERRRMIAAGADGIYRVRANGTDEARTKICKEIREWQG